jgi:hypothetical protein
MPCIHGIPLGEPPLFRCQGCADLVRELRADFRAAVAAGQYDEQGHELKKKRGRILRPPEIAKIARRAARPACSR